MKVAYLASQQTMPGTARRRADAIEHDQMMAALRAEFANSGDFIQDIAWDDKTVDWQLFDAAVIGSTWDYCERHQEFLQTIEQLHRVVPVFNSPALVKWSSNKRYLHELQAKGVATVPTYWLDDSEQSIQWQEIFALFNSEKLVVKQQIGANAEGQFILHRSDPAPQVNQPMMVQPFLPTIASEGEYSFVFIDNQLSHALLKRPAAGDYRIQSSYGGTESVASPTPEEIESAGSALAALDETPLYARVDMLRNSDGQLVLMELELIEPFLYPLQGPNLGTLLHVALKKRVEQ